MHELPTTQEEFLAWKITDPGYHLHDVQNYEPHWFWIKDHGMRLFAEHFDFTVEVDAGLGFETHVFRFCNKIILVTHDSGLNSRNVEFHRIDDLEKIYGKLDPNRVLI